jgi:hypothetical protein
MADLELVFGGGPWRKNGSKQESKQIFNSTNRRSEDTEQEKIFSSTTRRTEAAIQNNRKIVDDLSRSLPIAASPDTDLENNYTPSRHTKESNQIEPFSVSKYTPPAIPATPDYAYQPASLPGPPRGEWDSRIDKLIRRMDREQTGETSTHDLVLYIFTGVFFLFVLDTFVTLGKRSR